MSAKLRAEMRRSGNSFKEIVNRALRMGLMIGGQPGKKKPFVIRKVNLDVGVDFNCAWDLIDRLDRHSGK